jgi:seryl-tRNA synthetase
MLNIGSPIGTLEALGLRFMLDGAIVFSGDLAKARDDITKALADLERGALQRGVPEGEPGPRITGHGIRGEELSLSIESGKFVRAHEALLRLRKELSTLLGKAHRVGARSVRIDRYVIEFELDRPPLREVKVPLASSLEFDGATAVLELLDVPEDHLTRNYVDRLVALVREKVAAHYYEGKAGFFEPIWTSPPRTYAFDRDPTEEMAKRGWVEQGPGKGRWFHRPQSAAVLRAMQRIAVEEVLEPLGFSEVISSTLVPFDIWLRTGHLQGVANEIYFVTTPSTRDEAAWEGFKDLVKVTRQVPTDMLDGLLDPVRAGLAYAQCPNIYWSFSGRTLSDADLPIRVFDRTVVSFRNESGGRHGIERVDEFHRIEPVYIGTPEQLGELREGLISRYRHVFDEVLELEWRMAWVSPFYLQQAGKAGGGGAGEGEAAGGTGAGAGTGAAGGRALQQAKRQGTIDFEAYLPYRGPRETSEWLEFQNLSVLGDIYTEAFNIKSQRAELWSGCSGIGLERWAAVFLAQHGLEPDGWPAGFRRYLGELPKGFRFM